MTQELAIRGEFTLPERRDAENALQAVKSFQATVKALFVLGHDYGVIPGTQKPTLLKPGAEKLVKLLRLADTYEVLDKVEDWEKPLFRYLIRCRLILHDTGQVVSEGLGECNTYESKYRWRWVGERDLPSNYDKATLVKQERKSNKTGGRWTVYRIPNDEIYSQVNTVLKMAKKRALVDAALSAGRLSDVFTQDIEDLHEAEDDAPTKSADPAVALGLKDDVHAQEPKQGAQARTAPQKAKEGECEIASDTCVKIAADFTDRGKIMSHFGAFHKVGISEAQACFPLTPDGQRQTIQNLSIAQLLEACKQAAEHA